MIVRTVVNQSGRAPDKMYDYRVPEELEEKIFPGSRLKVPFGKHNAEVEAYVFAVKKRSAAKNLKDVIEVYDRAFDENMLSLIEYIREECVCTYMDVIKTVLPAGTINKPDEWLELTGEHFDPADEILSRVRECGGSVEINSLLAMFETDKSVKIRKLLTAGALKSVYRDRREVADKQITAARLNVGEEALDGVLAALRKSRAFVQARMLEILSGAGRVSLADLVRFSEGSYGAVRALQKKGYVTCERITVMRTLPQAGERDEKKTLTAEQKAAYDRLCAALGEDKFSEFLFFGVTGSGKTEVYMQAIQACVDGGRSAIMLVPEISLTPQAAARFSARFGERIALLHSRLSPGERYDQWRRIRAGEADIVIGARSAVFAPCENIGIIIIDEEHESSYKSEMTPKYNTAEVARYRAKQNSAVLCLASATPRVEDFYDAKNGRAELLTLSHRVGGAELAEVEIVDMRRELERGNRTVISEKLREEIAKNLERGEQTILFLNRRGFSTFVSCRSCGYVAECPNCSISLTYHKFSNSLKCHYCGYRIPNYTRCPECGSDYIRYFGGGTQKVQEQVAELFGDARIMRMDNDTTGKKNAHASLLAEFAAGGADILIGTQMVAKGLDFENVTLVGVISADTSLFSDDFRAAERTFSLLEQVTGRAGRAKKPGRAIIQTYAPENPAVMLAAAHDYGRFWQGEIKRRRAMSYPPFCEIISICFSSENEAAAAACANCFARSISQIKNRARVIGPIRAAIEKIQNKHRRQLIIKAPRGSRLTSYISEATADCRKNKNYDCVAIIPDKNPNNIY